jgi:uncharacterized protein YoxC
MILTMTTINPRDMVTLALQSSAEVSDDFEAAILRRQVNTWILLTRIEDLMGENLEKIFNPAEHRVPPGSGRSSGSFAPGRVTGDSSNQQSSGGGGGGGSGSGSGASSHPISPSPTEQGEGTPQEAALDAHAQSMATMDLQAAARLETQVKSLESSLKQLNQEIKFWSKPFKPSTKKPSATASAGSKPKATAGSSVSSGKKKPAHNFPTFQAFLSHLKNQAAGVGEHIQDLNAQIRALRQRAAEWIRSAQAPEPEVTKEIALTAGQLRAVIDGLTSAEIR